MKKIADASPSASTKKSLPKFFALIFVLSASLWAIGVVIILFLPKDNPLYLPVNLLWHVSLAIIPMVAALARDILLPELSGNLLWLISVSSSTIVLGIILFCGRTDFEMIEKGSF